MSFVSPARACGAAPLAGDSTPLGWWTPNGEPLRSESAFVWDSVRNLNAALYFLRTVPGERWAVGCGGAAVFGSAPQSHDAREILGFAPACRPSALGDPTFRSDHRLRFAYMTGAMANGIASESLVESIGRAGMLGCFGAAGLPVRRVEQAIDRISNSLGDLPFGFNLIHTPNEPRIEEDVVGLYLRRGIRLVEASAYLDLTLPLLRYRLHGIHHDADGRTVTPNRVIAKLSRVEVAAKFFSPAPERLLEALVTRGDLTREQAEMARHVPVAQDVTAEADSGGHTDNRPALCLLPTILALRDRMQQQHGYAGRLRVGAAGGIATPASAAAAFAMGAAYVVTGSVNQACVESGTSDLVRQMLAEAGQADTAMAPAADMFEMGVKLQVLKRGTMFAMRAQKLYDVFRAYETLDQVPAAERVGIEKTLFRASFEEIWQQTQSFFRERDPSQIEKGERDPKHKMALVFRWYLGLSSHWANAGDAARKIDYQIWCGPAMGAFNEWAKGSPFERPENRKAADVARQILYGAAVALRVAALRAQGLPLPEDQVSLGPVEPELLADFV